MTARDLPIFEGYDRQSPAVDFNGLAKIVIDMAYLQCSSGSPVIFDDHDWFASAHRFQLSLCSANDHQQGRDTHQATPDARVDPCDFSNNDAPRYVVRAATFFGSPEASRNCESKPPTRRCPDTNGCFNRSAVSFWRRAAQSQRWRSALFVQVRQPTQSTTLAFKNDGHEPTQVTFPRSFSCVLLLCAPQISGGETQQPDTSRTYQSTKIGTYSLCSSAHFLEVELSSWTPHGIFELEAGPGCWLCHSLRKANCNLGLQIGHALTLLWGTLCCSRARNTNVSGVRPLSV